MNYSDYRFTLDIQLHQAQVSVPVTFNDSARRLCIGLTDGRKPYIIGKGCFAVFNAKKPDGTKIKNYCIIENNTVIYEFTPQTTSCEGIVNCDITIYDIDGKALTSPQFIIVVDEKVVRDDGIDLASQDESTILSEIVAEELQRQSAETDREAAETKRKDNEKTRNEFEVERRRSEADRNTNENVRIEAENGRVSAENERVEAETARQALIGDIDSALDVIIESQRALLKTILLTFKVNEGALGNAVRNFVFKEGMTWGEWVGSEYNTEGYYINMSGRVCCSDSYIYYEYNPSETIAERDDLIEAYHVYVVQ